MASTDVPQTGPDVANQELIERDASEIRASMPGIRPPLTDVLQRLSLEDVPRRAERILDEVGAPLLENVTRSSSR